MWQWLKSVGEGGGEEMEGAREQKWPVKRQGKGGAVGGDV
jgi:hypothetical protein